MTAIWIMLPTKEEKEMKSDQIKKGGDRAANRRLLYALGLTEEDILNVMGKVIKEKFLDLNRKAFTLA